MRASFPGIIGRRSAGRDRASDGSQTFEDSRAVIVLGGSSEIGVAIARALVDRGARTVVLAGRSPERMLAQAGNLPDLARVETIEFDARATDTHTTVLQDAFAVAGETQAVVVTFGVLGETRAFEISPTLAGGASTVNFAGAVSASLAAMGGLTTQESRGTLIVLSSMAMVRPRLVNYVYGAAKAGLDFFARGLADSYRGRVRVLIVRPGFVTTKMTAQIRRKPLTITPEHVARDVLKALDGSAKVCYTPGVIRYVGWGAKLAPGWMMRLQRP